MKRVVKIKVMIEMALMDHVLVIGTLYYDLRVAVTQEQTFLLSRSRAVSNMIFLSFFELGFRY
jgi:hypothetical protein